MNARDEILGRIRQALGPSHGSAPTVPRGYRDTASPGSSEELFVERVEDYRATVTRCPADRVAGVIGELLHDASRVVVPEGFPYPVDGSVTDTGLRARELDSVDAVVTTAAVGIATTGTIVLDHGPGQGRRALSLVPDLHVCVIREDQIVAGVPDAIARLDPEKPQTWISGPSATSDIELNRVEGVHGPRRLRVVLVSA